MRASPPVSPPHHRANAPALSSANSAPSTLAPRSGLPRSPRGTANRSSGNTICRTFDRAVLQRPVAQPIREPVHKSVHDAKDLLRSLLCVRYFQRQGPGPRNRLQKKSRRCPRRQPHLPRLQHNVSRAPPPFKFLLHRIRLQPCGLSRARSHHQQLLCQRYSGRAPAQAGGILVQDPSVPFQLSPAKLFQAHLPFSRRQRAFFSHIRHRSTP